VTGTPGEFLVLAVFLLLKLAVGLFWFGVFVWAFCFGKKLAKWTFPSEPAPAKIAKPAVAWKQPAALDKVDSFLHWLFPPGGRWSE
jgi:hypothetical protein